MSQQKAQLINATENVTIPGGIDVSGVTTAGNFIGSFSGTATGLSGTPNLNVGIVTATLYGDGSNLTGAGSSAFIGVVTAAQSGTTTIDLSLGNTIYFTQDTNTTVAFANTEAVQKLKFIRVKDDTTTARTITWPSSIIWNGGTEPTLIDSSQAGEVQIFNLTTRDQGVTWYGYEAMKNDPAEPVVWYMLGENSSGSLGQNDRVHYSSPIQLSGTQWSEVFLNSVTSFGVKTDGTLWSWGSNSQGILGQNDEGIPRSSPTQLPGTQWSASSISSGKGSSSNHRGMVKTDGTMWVWGSNTNGRLGLNHTSHRSSPTQVPGTNWSGWRAASSRGSWMLKTDGTLWWMGYMYSGMSGANVFNISRSSPIQLPGTQWSDWAGAANFSLGLKTDGTLWSWGYSSNGVSGQNTNSVDYSSPKQIPGTQWSQICSGSNQQAGAIKTDGTLWLWGIGGSGSNGQNNVISYSSPVQVPGTWNRVTMSFNNSTVMATKTDGTLWGWGENNGYGLAGYGSVPRSSPYQIPGTQWSYAKMGINQVAIRQG